MSSMSKEIGNKLFLSESKYSDKWLNSYRETEFPVPHKDSNQRSKNKPRYTTSPLGRTKKYFFLNILRGEFFNFETKKRRNIAHCIFLNVLFLQPNTCTSMMLH